MAVQIPASIVVCQCWLFGVGCARHLGGPRCGGGRAHVGARDRPRERLST
jgi:hypothetical protein